MATETSSNSAPNKTDRDKAQKFKDLATTRVRRVIKDLQLVGNLANSSNYEYTPQQVKKIMKAINTEVRALKLRFESGGEVEEDSFTL